MFFSSFRRSAASVPVSNDPVISAETAPNSVEPDYDSFQQVVSNQFHELTEVSVVKFLSISWIRNLLYAFTACQEDFRVILSHKKDQLSDPSVDRFLSEFFDKSIKALDICNASRDGIEKIRQWQKKLDIVLCILDSRKKLGEAQFRRAHKALMDLPLLMMIDDKQIGVLPSYHNRSFGRRVGKNRQSGITTSSHSRSLSWSVPVSSYHASLSRPKPPNSFYNPASFLMSPTFGFLHSRITDELKKQERKECSGLLTEVFMMEKRISHMTDLVDAVVEFPLTEEQNEEVKDGMKELRLVYDIFTEKLDPLDRHLREVFLRIMSCHNDGLQSCGNV